MPYFIKRAIDKITSKYYYLLEVIKLKTIKLNLNNKMNYIRNSEEVYYIKLIKKALRDIANGDYYTEEEFWEKVKETEMEEFGTCLEHNIHKKYA